MESFIVGLFAGIFGMAYFMYGKRTQKFAPMIAGVLLCVYPYFFDDLVWLLIVGVVLMAAPFFIHE
jgi:hypothetical protein